MAYFALVTKLHNYRKDENSDKLWLADCYGEGVIVGPDMSEDELVLYMPTDGRLERWFGNDFSLFRKNEDGTSQGGYVDDNGHIKAVKLRGNQSSGIVMRVSAIYEKYGDQHWREDMEVTQINGKTFVEKYIPKPRHIAQVSSGRRKQRGNPRVSYPEFDMHIDTAQLAYNLAQFHEGDTINLSVKMHGCFIKGTKIRMANNKLKAIESIKVGDKVLGYDISTGKIVPTTVLNTFKNAPSSKWNELKFSREYIRGDKRGTQISTYNHKYWVEEKKAWIEACNLKVGDTISTLFPSPVLTSLQKEVAIGSFLGDGCLLVYGGRTAELQETKKLEHQEYLQMLSELTSGWIYKAQEKISGYNSQVVVYRSARSADLYNYFKDVSTFSNKSNDCRLLDGIVDKVTPLSLALWYCGDGSLAHSDSQQDRALLAICRYTEKTDREIIDRIFKKFNIIPTFYQDSEHYWRIRFNLDEATKFFGLIASYIPPCMQYKLPLQFQGRYIVIQDTEVYNPNGYVLSPQVVLENNPINETFDEYDLETELHNYVVGMTIVHNTSQRSMNTYGLIPNKGIRGFFRRLFHMGEKKIENQFVLGTRRCVVYENSTGFYGKDDFRRQHHEAMKPFIKPSQEVFYEVVGWYGPNETDTIMAIGDNTKLKDKEFQKKFGKQTVFSYGCEVGESKPYVYRITENNGAYEYTPAEIMAWVANCQEHGAKVYAVPFLENFTFTTAEDLMERVNKELADLVDPVGGHLKEGVVVRILNRRKFTAFKSKVYEFRVLEGLIKDSEEAPDMEEAQDAKEL